MEYRVKTENSLEICDLSNEVVLIFRIVLKWGFTVCFSCREMENASNYKLCILKKIDHMCTEISSFVKIIAIEW